MTDTNLVVHLAETGVMRIDKHHPNNETTRAGVSKRKKVGSSSVSVSFEQHPPASSLH